MLSAKHSQVIVLDFKCSLDILFGTDMGEPTEKNPHAVQLGQLGGKARVGRLTPERRREIARKAALARWAKERKKKL
jgi:hypothetical protein